MQTITKKQRTTKRIYFVRHGETDGNIMPVHGHPEHMLTEKGQGQAAFIADRLSKLPIDALITSTYSRAITTGEFISKKTGLLPEQSDLFIECKFVSRLWGSPLSDAEPIRITQLIKDNWGKPGYRVEDEENFEDIIARTENAFDYLSARPEENIAVVTHGMFLRYLLARALHGAALTVEKANSINQTALMENTGITIFGYDPSAENPWYLWVWNDHAHLG